MLTDVFIIQLFVLVVNLLVCKFLLMYGLLLKQIFSSVCVICVLVVCLLISYFCCFDVWLTSELKVLYYLRQLCYNLLHKCRNFYKIVCIIIVLQIGEHALKAMHLGK